jgi:hypothetical protein
MSYPKYVLSEQLGANDYKTLLKKVKTRDDLPFRSRLLDLQQQWLKRKHRLDAFLLTPPATVETMAPSTNVRPQVILDPLVFEVSAIGSASEVLLTHENILCSAEENIGCLI